MKRININYGGFDYTIAHTDLDEVKATIMTAFHTGTPTWLSVNHGEGTYRETDLMIAPGTRLAITGIDAD